MSSASTPNPALAALSVCDNALEELDKMCCDPGRSPTMKRLGDTIGAARTEVADGVPAEQVLALLEDAGSQVGRLQVTCCAPSRMPLYAEILKELTNARLAIKNSPSSSR